jgi:(4S)-4-hydroxy-5-phosphonooxypentane-2,3-dione isomerase
MLIVMVDIHVKEQFLEAFIQASVENASNSLQEAGISRFDLIQDNADPKHFLLVEAYRDAQASASHKETAHYKKWRDTVEQMMAEPRKSVKYSNIYPQEK